MNQLNKMKYVVLNMIKLHGSISFQAQTCDCHHQKLEGPSPRQVSGSLINLKLRLLLKRSFPWVSRLLCGQFWHLLGNVLASSLMASLL